MSYSPHSSVLCVCVFFWLVFFPLSLLLCDCLFFYWVFIKCTLNASILSQGTLHRVSICVHFLCCGVSPWYVFQFSDWHSFKDQARICRFSSSVRWWKIHLSMSSQAKINIPCLKRNLTWYFCCVEHCLFPAYCLSCQMVGCPPEERWTQGLPHTFPSWDMPCLKNSGGFSGRCLAL